MESQSSDSAFKTPQAFKKAGSITKLEKANLNLFD